jgi:guanylate kinase
VNRLLNETQIAEIEKIIKDYRPDPAVFKKFQRSSLAVITGPAAAGKDTLRNGLTVSDEYIPVLSTTTRPIRKGESEGKTYHFADYESIKDGLKKGRYFQAALVHNQQVSVLDVSEIEKLGKDKTGLSILIVQTEKEIHEHKPDIKTIFLIPPSFKAMINRLRKERDTEAHEVDRRLSAAKKEIAVALSTPRYQCIVSDKQEVVQKTARQFLSGDGINLAEDHRARKTMRAILEKL